MLEMLQLQSFVLPASAVTAAGKRLNPRNYTGSLMNPPSSNGRSKRLL